LKASWSRYTLQFAQPGGTSRGILTTKDSYLINIHHNQKTGVGECGLLRGLSCDDRPDYAYQLQWTCDNIHLGCDGLYAANHEFPSIQFGIEMAFKDLEAHPNHVLFPSDFTRGAAPIPINGLIWMGVQQFI
jgi:O-succinylbenzoate synthase